VQYGEAVTLQLKLRSAEVEAFKTLLTDTLRGQIRFAEEGEPSSAG